jgi:hypothetical protein
MMYLNLLDLLSSFSSFVVGKKTTSVFIDISSLQHYIYHVSCRPQEDTGN